MECHISAPANSECWGGEIFFNLKVIPGYNKRSTSGVALESDEHVKTRRL